MFVSLCLTLPVIQRNLRMVEINKYYYYYYYFKIQNPLTDISLHHKLDT